MIPKKIHYCWFGRNPLPLLAEKCIASWKKFLPDYEIICWNEDNFDVNMIAYTKEAYEAKKYAFVSDYARFYIIHKYGGIYFDTDVEVIKNMDEIISAGPFFGCEQNSLTMLSINPGLGFGASSGMKMYELFLAHYQYLHFRNKDGGLNLTTIVDITTDIFMKHGLKVGTDIQCCGNIIIYPPKYFCPRNEARLPAWTPEAYSIHHYAASWCDDKATRRIRIFIKKIIYKCFGKYSTLLVKLKRLIIKS